MIDRWKGFYTYEVGYPYEWRSKPHIFNLEWVIDNGVIKGSCFDEECKSLFTKPANIEGFIEDDFVSFIKKYPSLWGYDRDNNLIAMKDLPVPEIHYSGNYVETHFQGIWEMTIVASDVNGKPYEQFCSGTWLMKRFIEKELN